MKKQAFYSSAAAMGDLICATPTIKKLAEIYQSTITVISNHPYLFNNCPYVDKILNFNDYTEEQLKEKYDLHISSEFVFHGSAPFWLRPILLQWRKL